MPCDKWNRKIDSFFLLFFENMPKTMVVVVVHTIFASCRCCLSSNQIKMLKCAITVHVEAIILKQRDLYMQKQLNCVHMTAIYHISGILLLFMNFNYFKMHCVWFVGNHSNYEKVHISYRVIVWGMERFSLYNFILNFELF
jgi:hypothetical protein